MNILESIRSNAATNPDRLAFVQNTPTQTSTLSWQELEAHSNRLAARLLQITEDTTPVIVYGHKDPLMITSFVACAKSGRAYCPVDVSVPQGRLQDIVREVCPKVVVAVEDLPDIDCGDAVVLAKDDLRAIVSAEADDPIDLTPHWVGPDDVYYIIFTSGSTGKPKGVQITRDCLDNFIRWGLSLCTNAQDEPLVFVNQAPFSFDLSVMDLYLALASGGTEFALSKGLLESMSALFERLRASNATVWVSTPSFVEMCLADPSFTADLLPRMRTFLFCGETLTNRTAERLMSAFPQAEVYNTYGPTESTVAVTGVLVTPEVSSAYVPLPIGVPKPGTAIHVVDEQGNDVETGTKGEIVIVGDSVSVGYFHDPERTQASFSLRDMDGRQMRSYRTGDEGYVRDGMLFYSGRIDLQIKMHGYRIELEDIEANIAALPGVIRVAVLPVRKPDGTVRSLTAFLVMDAPAASFSRQDVKGLRAQLASSLPSYMIPKRLRIVDDLPVTNNGKVDRKKLAEL